MTTTLQTQNKPEAMVRMQVYISRSARDFLASQSNRTGESQGSLIRAGIKLLARQRKESTENL